MELELKGLSDIKAKMRQLKKEVQTKAARSATLAAAKVLRDQAIQNATAIDDPKTREAIYKNVSVKFSSKTTRKTGNPSYRIGILGGARANLDEKAKAKAERRRARKGQKSLAELGEFSGKGKGNPGGDTFYWRFIEFGTKKMQARPFMRPVLNQSGQKALDAFVITLDKAINRQIKKAGKAK